MRRTSSAGRRPSGASGALDVKPPGLAADGDRVRVPPKLVLTLPWFMLRSYWQRKRFDERARHEIVVAPGPDGRPGERLVAPSRSLYRPKVVPGSRNDFCVFLDPEGSSLQAVCLGPVAERGEPERSARDTLEHYWSKGWVTLKATTVERIGGEEAFRYSAAVPTGDLTEWQFAHDGWLYIVGAMNHAPDDGPTITRAREALDSWEWL
jgi:hypothetical protein